MKEYKRHSFKAKFKSQGWVFLYLKCWFPVDSDFENKVRRQIGSETLFLSFTVYEKAFTEFQKLK